MKGDNADVMMKQMAFTEMVRNNMLPNLHFTGSVSIREMWTEYTGNNKYVCHISVFEKGERHIVDFVIIDNTKG